MAKRTWLGRRREEPRAHPHGRSVMAAAMPLVGPDVAAMEVRRTTTTAEAWQTDAWYFYDTCGELYSPVNWIANLVSRATIQAVEIDPATGLDSGPTENAQVQAAVSQVLGGYATRAQLQYFLAVAWQVPGEAYVIIRPRPAAPAGEPPRPDEWLVLSGKQVQPKSGAWQYNDPATGLPQQLGPNDRLIRVWAPHPNEQWRATSAVRPALAPLREVENASANIASRLVSRVAMNGILPIPQELDFPKGEGETDSMAFSRMMLEGMAANIKAVGEASAQVPFVITMPAELMERWKDAFVDISTDFDASVSTLRAEALGRVAAALDMPKEVAEGTQGESNHWSAWLVSEDTYKVYIEPLLDRLGDALTEYWFHPVLRTMGVADPQRYQLAWDTTEIVSRPDATEDLNWLYEQRLISDDYRRQQSGVPDEAIPTDEERQRRLGEDVLTQAPSVALTIPSLAGPLLGIDASEVLAAQEVAAGGPAPSAVESGTDDGAPALPATASTATQEPDTALVAAAELLVYDALSRAGGRMLNRENRVRFGSVPKHDLYRSAPLPLGRTVPYLLEGSFQFAGPVAAAAGVSEEEFVHALSVLTRALLSDRRPYDRAELVGVLREMLR